MIQNEIHLVSGGFDPIHSGHIDLIENTGDYFVVVALNSDEWLIRKKGTYFLPWDERARILRTMDRVLGVMQFDDSDDSACDAIIQLKKQYPDYTIHFYNGGDRNEGNILEALRFADDPQVVFHYGTGGKKKKNSSSQILQDWLNRKLQTTERNWGVYQVLRELPRSKLKLLQLEPGQSISMQYHNHRNEHWFVAQGEGELTFGGNIEDTSSLLTMPLTSHSQITIPAKCWHKLSNTGTEPMHIVEIQYGSKCEEADIVRQSR